MLAATALSSVTAGRTRVTAELGSFSGRGMVNSHILDPTGKVTLERFGVGYKVHKTRVWLALKKPTVTSEDKLKMHVLRMEIWF